MRANGRETIPVPQPHGQPEPWACEGPSRLVGGGTGPARTPIVRAGARATEALARGPGGAGAARGYSARRAISVLTFVDEHDSSYEASGTSSSTSSLATRMT